MRKLGASALVVVLALGAYTLISPEAVMGKGKPKPPPCECAEEIDLGNGTVCTLVDCGSDCVYSCPLPG